MSARKTWRALYGILAATLVWSSLSSAKEKVIQPSPKGFEEQFKPVFKAYKHNDPDAIESSLDTFAIPDHWFTDVFGPNQGPELARVYADQFEDFKAHVPRSLGFSLVLVGKRYQATVADLEVRTDLVENVAPKPAPKPPPLALQPLPPIMRFETKTSFHVRGSSVAAGSWMDSFIYVEGRFRFLGRGAYPFWDAANVRRADPCAKPGEQTGGQLLTRVEPTYPEEAKQKKIEGIVRLRLTVAKDGSVKEVEIVDGDPLLVDAAKQAALQWRYAPFMNCGNPVEMRSMEHVKFTLPTGAQPAPQP